MRTTVTVDPDVEALLRQAMQQSGQSFKITLNQAVRRGLADVVIKKDEKPFVVKAKDMGLRPGIDIAKIHDLEAEWEVEAFLDVTRKLEERLNQRKKKAIKTVIVPDSNLILYAYNSASPEHEAAKHWWETLLSGEEPIGLVHPVILSFLRVSTNSHAFSRPLSLSHAAELIEEWLERKNSRLLLESQSHISQVINILTAAGSSGGNLVVDAQIAAIAMAHKATVHTADRDFMRFRGLDCYFPLDEAVRK